MYDKPSAVPPLEDQAKQLGAALRARRKQLAINMTAASEAAHVSRVTWHRLEKGQPSVAWGALLAAASALGLRLTLTSGSDSDGMQITQPVQLDKMLPLQIPLKEFPGLRKLAWQVGESIETLTPREAFGLYTRNARHLNRIELSQRESSLIKALHSVYGEPDQSV
jgi:transcriptional regulator with XRE-family HTH domain